MKNNVISIILNFIVLIFLLVTFFLQSEYLFTTRIVAVLFVIRYLIIEIKKGYFLTKKGLFLSFSIVSIAALVFSIGFDNGFSANAMIARDVFIPIYTFILIVILYKDLYDERKMEQTL